MLQLVQAQDFLLGGDAEAYRLLQYQEGDYDGDDRPRDDDEHTPQLLAELSEAAAVEDPFPDPCEGESRGGLGREEPDGDRSPDAVHHVHADSSDRVVDV